MCDWNKITTVPSTTIALGRDTITSDPVRESNLDLSLYPRSDLEAFARNQMRFIAGQQARLEAQAVEIWRLKREIAEKEAR
jgi:hypothetical protein